MRWRHAVVYPRAMPKDPPLFTPAATRARPLHDDIAKRAYELWDRSGRPEERDVEFWLAAERQLLGVDPVVTQTDAGAVPASALADATSGGKRKRPRHTPELATNTGR